VVVVEDLSLGAGRQLLLGERDSGPCLISEGQGAPSSSAAQLPWVPDKGEEVAALCEIPGPLYPLGALVPDWPGQPARLESGRSLDPEREALDLLRGADAAQRLEWVLELARGVKGSIALDPAALALSPSAPHLRSLDPMGTAAEEPAQVEALAKTTLLLLTSSLPRERKVPEGRLSPLLVDLLQRALDERPLVRPSLSSFAKAIERALGEEDYAWRPRERPLVSVLVTAGALCMLWGASHLSPPPAPRLAAQEAFLAAASEEEQNPAAGRLSLERLAQAKPVLPEARRALALGELRRWRATASPSPRATRELIELLERDGWAGRDDDLAAALKTICGVLRRWELGPRGDEEAAALGDALLRDLALRPGAGDDLRLLAKAALRARPQGGGPALPGAELETVTSSGDEGGFLQRAYVPIRYPSDPNRVLPGAPAPADGLGAQPPERALDMGWIAHLVAGQHHAIAGRQAEASALLRRAYAAFPCYATQVSLGLTLLRGPGEERSEGEALLQAPAQAPGGARLRLALAEGALAAGRLRTAIPELRAVSEQEGASPIVRGRATLVLRQAELLRAGRRVAEDPRAVLESLQSLLPAQGADPYRGDLLLIAAAAQARLGHSQLGAKKIWEWLGDKSLKDALASLPSLPLQLPTRDPQAVRALLLQDLVARASEGVRRGADEAEQLEGLRGLLGDAAAEEAGTYALLDAALAALRYVTGKADLGPALEALAAGTAARAPAQSLARIELEVRLRASVAPDPHVALGHLNAVHPALVASAFEGSELKAARGRWRQQVLATLRRVQTKGQKAWAGLSPEAPKASASVLASLPVLQATLNLLDDLPNRQEPRLLAAELRRVAGSLSLVQAGAEGRRDPAAFARALRHFSAGIKLLSPLPPDPEVSEVRKRLHLASGLALLDADPKALEAARSELPTDQPTPQAIARTQFCRAGGLLDAAMWREEIDAGFKPLGPTGREQAPLYWVARSYYEEAKATPAGKRAALKAAAVKAYADLAGALGSKSPPPGGESWRQEAAWSKRADKPK
jgi:hypothetical protein